MPSANGIAERHNLVLLDMILPMLADSADPDYGLPHLSHSMLQKRHSMQMMCIM
jgi:hypothetical protein